MCSTELLAQYSIVAKMSKVVSDTSFYNDLSAAARGSYVANDIDGDGRPELIMTDYSNGGRVHVYEAAGQDSVELVWSSPDTTASFSGGNAPRCVTVGDLDNDGRKEIIFPTYAGIFIYEWDGVKGSGNFGTQPSQVINSISCPGLPASGPNRVEAMWVGDIDGDGTPELVTVWNCDNSSDRLYLAVIQASGGWDTNSPGFSGFNLIYSVPFTNNLGGGQPIDAFVGDFNGSGKDNILVHTYNYVNIFPVRVTGTSKYALPDTTVAGAFLHLMDEDGTALLGGIVTDIDNDGVDELYLPIYADANSDDPHNGRIYMVSYPKGNDLSTIDTSDVSLIVPTSPAKTLAGNKAFNAVLFGGDWADMDGNGQKELYFGSTSPADVIRLDYMGGNKRDPNNWESSIVYSGEHDVYSTINYQDSLGTMDTVRVMATPFVSKLFAENMDFNGDGKPDILIPYQGINDSITVNWKHFDTGTSAFVTDSSGKIPNPKIWFGRILEYTGATGIKGQDLVLVTPNNYKLEQNYPNPFNPSTKITFSLPLTKQISLTVYDILGNKIKDLISNEVYQKGTHEVTWDGTNNYGMKVASGVYIYTLKFGNFSKSLKMTMLK